MEPTPNVRIVKDGEDFTTVWECPEPPDGSTFRVTGQQWNATYTERRITAVELVDAGA